MGRPGRALPRRRGVPPVPASAGAGAGGEGSGRFSPAALAAPPSGVDGSRARGGGKGGEVPRWPSAARAGPRLPERGPARPGGPLLFVFPPPPPLPGVGVRYLRPGGGRGRRWSRLWPGPSEATWPPEPGPWGREGAPAPGSGRGPGGGQQPPAAVVALEGCSSSSGIARGVGVDTRGVGAERNPAPERGPPRL